MPSSLDDPGWNKLQQDITDALAPFAPMLGARRCAHADNWGQCEEEDCLYLDTEPIPGSMPTITHFLLLTSTYDIASGPKDLGIQVAIAPPTQSQYIGLGLATDYIQS